MSLSNLIGYLIAGALLVMAYIPMSQSVKYQPAAAASVAAYLLYSMMGKKMKANIAPLVAVAATALAYIPGAPEAVYGEKYIAPLDSYFKNVAGGISLGVILARLQF